MVEASVILEEIARMSAVAERESEEARQEGNETRRAFKAGKVDVLNELRCFIELREGEEMDKMAKVMGKHTCKQKHPDCPCCECECCNVCGGCRHTGHQRLCGTGA